MARITVEDCLRKVDNRFGLIHLAAKRVRQLRKGSEPLVVCKNKDIVVALREIANDKVFQSKGESGNHLDTENENAVHNELGGPTEGESPVEEQQDETQEDQGAVLEEK